MKIQVHAVHFTMDRKLQDLIEKKLLRLQKVQPQIMDAEVWLKLENSGQVKDKIVEIKLHVPGSNHLVVKDTSKSFEVALNLSVETLRRQLVKIKERSGVHGE